jgi:hypothetical protein
MKKGEHQMLMNLHKLEKSLWNEIVEYEGNDKEMADFVAQDRNDVIEARSLYFNGDMTKLSNHIDPLDTSIREAIVIAFAADLGSSWVRENLGYEVR